VQKDPQENDQIRRFFSEIISGTWKRNAQGRSRRRKSAWNLLLLLLGLLLYVCFASLFITLIQLAHTTIYPEAVLSLRGFLLQTVNIASLLMLLPPLIASVFPAFLVANYVVYLIPPARRAMQTEDADFPGTDYNSSQAALAKMGLPVTIAALVLALIGAAIG